MVTLSQLFPPKLGGALAVSFTWGPCSSVLPPIMFLSSSAHMAAAVLHRETPHGGLSTATDNHHGTTPGFNPDHESMQLA